MDLKVIQATEIFFDKCLKINQTNRSSSVILSNSEAHCSSSIGNKVDDLFTSVDFYKTFEEKFESMCPICIETILEVSFYYLLNY